jgi:serine phosphatase RsbU (regulator of sigma subunit)/tetratricopeptide (TPR) repeat protein
MQFKKVDGSPDPVSIIDYLALMNWRQLILCIAILSISNSVRAQDKRAIDSLNTLLQKEKQDTVRVFIMLDIGNEFGADTSSAIREYNEAQQLAQQINYPRGVAASFIRKGRIMEKIGDFDEARNMYDSALSIYEQNHLDKRYAMLCINMGNTYYTQGDYKNAVLWNQKAADGCEQLKDYSGQAQATLNFGNVFYSQMKYQQAIDYYLASLKLCEQIHDSITIGSLYNNLGAVYFDQKKFPEAQHYFEQSLVVRQNINDDEGIASSICNLAELWHGMGDLKKSLDYYQQAQTAFENVPDMVSAADNSIKSAVVVYEMGDHAKAITMALNGLSLATQYGDLPTQKEACDQLSKFYSGQNDFHNAFLYLQRYTKIQDSLMGETTIRQLTEMQTKFETVKKEKENEKLKKNEALKDKQIEEKDNQRRLLFAGIGFVLVLVVVMIIAYVNKRRSNITLANKNALIESQKQEITDSITYARRIQQAILPPVESLKKHFPESAVLYLPKAIVSGDFWWLHDHGNELMIAVGDCTGHGVPGAFMSMLGVDKLTALAADIHSPDKLLAQLNRSVKSTLHLATENSSVAVRDGMDIALISISSDRKKIRFSSANRPLWICRSGKEWLEFKPTKAAIGGHTSDEQEFELHELNLQPNDRIYLFTDGFADQFGGDEGKKIMTRRFRDWLNEIQQLSMEKQRDELQFRFERWKGTTEQVDDVLLIGIRV